MSLTTKKIDPVKNRAYVKKHIQEKLDEIKIRPPKGTKEKWSNAAAEEGKSLQRFIIDIVDAVVENKKEG